MVEGRFLLPPEVLASAVRTAPYLEVCATPLEAPEEEVGLTDARGALWVADAIEGIWRMEGGDIARIDLRPDNERESAIALSTDRSGRIWIGFADGVLMSYLNGATERFTDREQAHAPAQGRAADRRGSDGRV